MSTIYTFNEKERAYVQAAHTELLRRLRNVAEIAGVEGNLKLAPDGGGFVAIEAPRDQGTTPAADSPAH